MAARHAPAARLVERQREPERARARRRCRTARHRAVAVLDHAHAAGRDEQRRAGRQVEAARGIAAGADDVDARGRRPAARAGARARAWRARSRALRRPSRPWRAAPRAARRPSPAPVSGSVSARSSSAASASVRIAPVEQLLERVAQFAHGALPRPQPIAERRKLPMQRGPVRASARSPGGTARLRPRARGDARP